MNEIIKKTRSNRFAGAKQKKEETDRCVVEIIEQQVPLFVKPDIVSVTWIEKNSRRDPDNIRVGLKFILDALVKTKRIPNDSKKWIKEIHDEFPEPSKESPRVIVNIKYVD